MTPHQKAVHQRLPRWLGPATNWSARFALNCPRVVPKLLRRAPLNACTGVVRLYVWGVL